MNHELFFDILRLLLDEKNSEDIKNVVFLITSLCDEIETLQAENKLMRVELISLQRDVNQLQKCKQKKGGTR